MGSMNTFLYTFYCISMMKICQLFFQERVNLWWIGIPGSKLRSDRLKDLLIYTRIVSYLPILLMINDEANVNMTSNINQVTLVSFTET